MKSGWLVRERYLIYEVYRLKDATDTEGEVEIESRFSRRDDAIDRAKELNKHEAERFWRGC